MPPRREDPLDILRRNRERAVGLAAKAGGPRTLAMLQRAQRDLEQRLRQAEGLRGAGTDSFTATQLRATLAQVRDVLRTLKPDLKTTITDAAKGTAEQAVSGTVEYLRAAEQRFRGVSAPLALREAEMLDRVAKGTEASVLRRLMTDPQDPASQGILDRYGENVVGAFEEQLQLRFLARKPWAEVRDALVQESPFLQGKPAHWAERIVRTEVMGANNRAGWESIREASREFDDMVKVLSATFDNRTAADSYAVHGQIRRPSEAFASWYGLFQHPPDRPNDRGVVVPHRLSWPLPATLKQKSDGEVLARWRWEGRKGSPPPRPKMSTVEMPSD